MDKRDDESVVYIDGKPEDRGVRRTKYKGNDEKYQEIVMSAFVGCDGTPYEVVIRENMLWVNGVEMVSWKDRPCEFACRPYSEQCNGAHDICSYKRLNLPGGCNSYKDAKKLDEDRKRFKKEQAK